jgi:sterol desaturase/sphingolipid hydroxylase (fatty acid hydroxylase superfamily)
MGTASATGPGPSQALNRLAISATTHCLTGCALGEATGFVIATALGWSDIGQIGLAVGLAYVFGFSLTAIPLVRAGLAAGVVISTALAADTISITIMEVIDNLTVILWPGALEAGIGDPIPYIAIAVGFVIAYPFAFWVNRYMIARGKGHARVHEHHHAH